MLGVHERHLRAVVGAVLFELRCRDVEEVVEDPGMAIEGAGEGVEGELQQQGLVDADKIISSPGSE